MVAIFATIAIYAVVAFAGAPLKGVDIKLGKNPGGSPAARATTDHEGKFEFEHLEPGTYDLYCSYEDCAKHAINTKGTGVAGRTAAPEFEIELLPSEGVSYSGPRQTTLMDRSKPRDVVVTNGPMLRVSITSQSAATSPLATITVSEKHHEIRGHVYSMYSVMK
jgi:hypothetical protein